MGESKASDPLRVKILGRFWRLRFTRAMQNARKAARRGEVVYGECDPPDLPNKEIRIRTGISDQERLETAIHEMLHAAGWHIDEEFVSQFSEDAARALWRLGYRSSSSGNCERF